MRKLQQINKIVINMLNKHENQGKETRNVKISENITKIDDLRYYTAYPKSPQVKTIIEIYYII